MDMHLRHLRHELRGRANTLMLCASALPYASEQVEKLDYLKEIEQAAESLVQILDELESIPEHLCETDSIPTPPAGGGG